MNETDKLLTEVRHTILDNAALLNSEELLKLFSIIVNLDDKDLVDFLYTMCQVEIEF